MIANFFRKTKPIHAIFISVLFLVYYLLAIFLVEKPEFSIGIVLKKVGFLILFLLLFFLVRFINRKNHLSSQNSYVLLLLTILFGIFPKTFEVQNIFYSHFFLLFAFRRIYSLKTNKNVKEKLFDSALWIGVATLFYSWSILFLILIYTSIFVRKKQELRTLIIPVVGFITPLFIVFVYCFFINNLQLYFDKFNLYYSFSYAQLPELLSILLIGLLILISIIFVSLKIHTLINDLKPSWILIIFHFLIATYLVIFTTNKEESFLFLFFPIAIIITNFLQLFDKMILRELIIISLLILSISTYFN